MKKYAVIVAGGSGMRMGTLVPKQFLLLRGKPVLWHTLNVFLDAYEDLEIILVLPEEHMETGKAILYSTPAPHRIRLIAGGATRFHSVRNGLQAVAADLGPEAQVSPGFVSGGAIPGGAVSPGGISDTILPEDPELDTVLPEDPELGIVMPKEALVSERGRTGSVIFVHDGVRCLLTTELVHRCYEKALEYGAAIPVIPSKDSVRLVTGEGNEAIDRNQVKLVQTPQTFLSEILLPSYQAEYRELFTDEATVVEASGYKVHLVEGEPNNIKITTPVDLALAEQLLILSSKE